MMDVLLLFEYPTVCGGEQSMLCLLPWLNAAGCRLRGAAPPMGPVADALARLDVEVVPLDLHDAAGVRRPLSVCRDALARVLAKCKPELVHANSLSMARMAGPVVAESGVPGVGHIRDIIRLSPRAVADINQQGRLLAVSHAAADFHFRQGLDRRRTVVLHNGVDLEAFQPRPATGYLHRELKLPPEAVLLAAVGQIGPRKGLDMLLRAMNDVLPQQPDAHLLVIGERFSSKQESLDFEQSLRATASTPPLSGHVHFLGWRTDLAKLLPELTLLVHAARQEPLGRVLLEAAACGCSIIATDAGGTREIFPIQEDASAGFSHAQGALLAPPADAMALALAIQFLLRNSSVATLLRNQARSRIVASFDAKSVAAKVLQHWKDVSH